VRTRIGFVVLVAAVISHIAGCSGPDRESPSASAELSGAHIRVIGLWSGPEFDIARFSAGDMMPFALQRAWWDAMLELVQDPAQLDAVLDRLTTVAADAR
jgi:hypothetical protein